MAVTGLSRGGGVCLRRFKTVLDTLRHSSQLPCIGIGEFTKELLRHVLVSIRVESTSRWQPAEFYSHKARAPPVASDLAYQTGARPELYGCKAWQMRVTTTPWSQ